MPVSQPPPLPPAEVPVARFEQAGRSEQVTAARGLTVHLVGFARPPTPELRDALARAATPLDAAATITAWLYQAGEVTAKVVYASLGPQVYVSYRHLPVKRSRDASPMGRYFAAVAPSGELDMGRFERARILASIQAERTGVDVQPRLVERSPGTLSLELKETRSPSRDPTLLRLDANNYGNRYAGRYGVDYLLRHWSTRGAEWQFAGRLAPKAVNSPEVGGSLHDGRLSYGSVSPAGVFGASAYWASFVGPAPEGAPALHGRIGDFGMEWSNVAWASHGSRLLGKLRAGYTVQEHTFRGDRVFREGFWTAEATPTWATSTALADQPLRIEASAALVHGALTGNAQTPAGDSFTLARPLLRIAARGDGEKTGGFTAAGQLCGDVVPQQQQWTLGGGQSLPAYRPGALFGDAGSYFRLDAGSGVTLGTDWRLGYTVFAEHGRAASAADLAPALSAGDAGVSVRLEWRRSLRLSATWAKPFAASSELTDQEADGYLSLSLSL